MQLLQKESQTLSNRVDEIVKIHLLLRIVATKIISIALIPIRQNSFRASNSSNPISKTTMSKN